MKRRHGRMVLSAFLLPGGYDSMAWRLPGSRSEELGTLGIVCEIARRFEQAKLDSLFIADLVTAVPLLDGNVKLGNPYEPITALSALASVTERIGLIGTISTTFNHPFTVARQLAALDVLSGGRAGWNIVTSYRAAENYGIELPSKEARYRRAREFVNVVMGLWSAWSDDAVINDRKRGLWLDPSRIAGIEHEGEFFKVSGFTNQRRSPQGHPVLVQAGQSADGLDFGAEFGELIYTVQPQRDQSIQYYKEHKARIAAAGRNPDHVKILPGLVPYVGRTAAEARDLQHSLADFLDFEKVRADFQAQYKVRIDDLDLDECIPRERFEEAAGMTPDSRVHTYRALSLDGGVTLREILINRASVGGHIFVSGSVSQVADLMVDWFEAHACDGYSINPPAIPHSLGPICDLLIPELQNRGYARTEYEATTLRGHLGLPHPSAWNGRAEAAE